MSERTGVSLGYLSQIELGKNSASIETLYRISLGLGVTVAGIVLQLSNHLQGHATIVEADFWPAFLVVGAVAACALLMLRQLPHNAGAEMAGHEQAKSA